MFGNILVHIPTELSARSAVNGSISLAVSTKAQLDAMAIGYERTIIPLIASAGTAVASIFEVEHAKALERAEAALRVFELEAGNSDIRYTTRALSAIPCDGREIICASARLHDLTVVTQPKRDHDSCDNVIPHEILFQAAGPVLFMPHTFYGAFSAKQIGIRWDGSRLAARALRDAMPLLREADALTIITITGPDAMPAESSTEHVLRYLARSGLPAKVASVPGIGDPTGPPLDRSRRGHRSSGNGRVSLLLAERKAPRPLDAHDASGDDNPGPNVALIASLPMRLFRHVLAACRRLQLDRCHHDRH